jgi:AraC-like DNA-binding protein
MDLIWTDGQLLVAGPDTTSFELPPMPNATFAGVRFRPGTAPRFLGVPASALLDTRANIEEVVPGRFERWVERLQRTSSAGEAASVLVDAVRASLPTAGPPDRLVQRAVTLLHAAPQPRPVAALAHALGASERQLHRRFVPEIGYGPKMLQRILRLRRFLAAASHTPALGLAALAAEAGYADQAHLSRDCARLTGLAPSRLAGTRLTAG